MRTFTKLLVGLLFVVVLVIAGGCLGVASYTLSSTLMPNHPGYCLVLSLGLTLMGGSVLATIIPRLFSFLAKKAIRL